jgi:[ribosomal protein S5]-alanine N-acetyltransferase
VVQKVGLAVVFEQADIIGLLQPFAVALPHTALWSQTLMTSATEDQGVRLDCGRCVLRPWNEGDASSLVRHANNYEVWRHMRDQFPHPYTREDADEWIAFTQQQSPQSQFALEVNGEAVGGIGLVLKSDVEHCSAEIGYWLGEAAWGRGIATAAVQALTGYGFETFGLTRIFAVPFANNPASMRVLEKAGYLREGVMRRSAIKEGVVLDQVLYAITDHDLARLDQLD